MLQKCQRALHVLRRDYFFFSIIDLVVVFTYVVYLVVSGTVMKNVILNYKPSSPCLKSQGSFGELQLPRPTPDLRTQMLEKSVVVSSLGDRCMCVLTAGVAGRGCGTTGFWVSVPSQLPGPCHLPLPHPTTSGHQG